MQLNLFIGWLWVLFGFVSGCILGLNFHRENWLGGYGSYRRRLYRLGHISFFGLALINLMFYFTAQKFPATTGWPVMIASWGFIVGAISMPLCCMIMAQNSKFWALFTIPVTSLIVGGLFTFLEVIKL